MTQAAPCSAILEEIVASTRGMRFEALPDEVVAMAKLCLLDWLGVTLAGAREPLVDILVTDSLEEAAEGSSTVVGRPERLRVLDAILVNGTAGHALDYDDGNPRTLGHPTAPIAPVALGLGTAGRASGRDVLTAFVAGYEAMAQVTAIMGAPHYRLGFHGTATMGTFGAAAAAIRLLRLNDAAARNAFGLAGTRAAGLRASFGTMAKPLHAGHAALVGASAARLARLGFTGARDIFGDPRGFTATHGGVASEWNKRPFPPDFAILGNVFKWHAACHLTHGAIDALASLARDYSFVQQDVSSVILRVPPAVEGVCDLVSPQSGTEAKFSLAMTAAFALAGVDTSDPSSFSDANVARPDLAALASRVAVVLDPAVTAGAQVCVRLVDGTALHGGSNPATVEPAGASRIDRVRAKFLILAEPVLGREPACRLGDAVMGLEQETDVASVMELARPAGSYRSAQDGQKEATQ
jgi:2-methylcitrate dehydratase PrpD